MPKYINADELIKAIETELWDWKTVDGIKSSTVLKQTISDIKNMPAADVVEVKHGEWKRLGKEKYINLATANEQYKVLGYPHRNIERLRCSECGMHTLVDETIAYDFCPHCGADMRGNAE